VELRHGSFQCGWTAPEVIDAKQNHGLAAYRRRVSWDV
jgi:hypothetical protein